jgi:rare lipoprotein A
MLPILTTLSVLSSWYGPGFHGNLTANGERFNQNALTAAHKTLPFGTRLKVCFNRCAVVRVNDRGPYIHGREIDLSKGAAEAIGLIGSGVGRVNVTRLPNDRDYLSTKTKPVPLAGIYKLGHKYQQPSLCRALWCAYDPVSFGRNYMLHPGIYRSPSR